MRTLYLVSLLKEISTINRGFMMSSFIGDDFLIKSSAQIAATPTALTSDAYKTNPHSKRFNFRLDHLPQELKDHQQFEFRSSFVFANSYFEAYVINLDGLVGRVAHKRLLIPSKDKGDTALELMFKSLGSSVALELGSVEHDTLRYIRLRRNEIVHRDEEITDGLRRILGRGRSIMDYWEKHELNLSNLDLTVSVMDRFAELDLVGLFRLLRYLSAKIDERILELLGRQALIDFAWQEFKTVKKKEVNNLPQAFGKVRGSFAHELMINFQINMTEADTAILNT